MKNRLVPLSGKVLLRERGIIEMKFDQLRSISQIEHTRHRSESIFVANLVCVLIACCYQPKDHRGIWAPYRA